MVMKSIPCWFAQCDGETGNAVQPHCTAVGPSAFHDADPALEAAEKTGWVAVGKKTYCPAHKPEDTAPPVEKVIRKRKADPPVPVAGEPSESFPDGGHQ